MSTVCTEPEATTDVQAEMVELDSQLARALQRLAEQDQRVDVEAAVASFSSAF